MTLPIITPSSDLNRIQSAVVEELRALKATIKITATLSFGTVAAQGVQTRDLKVPGAAVGDPVSIGNPSNLPTTIVATAVVTAPGTVTVRLHNPSSGAVATTAAAWTLWVLR
jgi:hypothetical protein